jgi:hypothetical protein
VLPLIGTLPTFGLMLTVEAPLVAQVRVVD